MYSIGLLQYLCIQKLCVRDLVVLIMKSRVATKCLVIVMWGVPQAIMHIVTMFAVSIVNVQKRVDI